jgi:hypothetical protein
MREGKPDARSFADGAFNTDVATVGFHELLGD